MTQPESTLVHDYSALSLLATCARKYKYRYRDRIVPADDFEPPYLHAGSVGHKGMHYLYTQAWDLASSLAVIREAWGSYTPSGKHGYLTLGHFELAWEAYFEDRSKRPTALEAPEAVSTRSGAEGAVVFDWIGQNGETLRVGGIPDLPTELASQRYIVDNKFTTGWINDQWAQKFRIGHQFRVYCAALYAITGVAYDGAYVNAFYMGEPPKSGWGKVKSVQNKLIGPFHYTPEQLQETWEWIKALQQTEALYERLGLWPQNEQACSGFSGCEYLPICERTPQIRPALIQMSYKVKPKLEGVLVSGADG